MNQTYTYHLTAIRTINGISRAKYKSVRTWRYASASISLYMQQGYEVVISREVR